MYVGNLARVYELIQSADGGGQVVVANAVGGGSNLYLAASIRAPERDVRAPRPPSRRRAGPPHVAGADLRGRRSTPTTRAPRPACA